MKWKGKDFNTVTRAKGFDAPLKWKDPQRIFVNPWSDFFIEEADEWRDEAMDVIYRSRDKHTFLILTKRIERVKFPWMLSDDEIKRLPLLPYPMRAYAEPWPNIWPGVSVENQRQADERIPKLLQIPAAKRFVSIEPLLGEINLQAIPVNRDIETRLGDFVPTNYPRVIDCLRGRHVTNLGIEYSSQNKIDWVIVGGESGGPEYRRLVFKEPLSGGIYHPTDRALQWVRSIWDQCQAAGVPFFFKQWGGPRPDSAGCMIGGKEWKQIPQQ